MQMIRGVIKTLQKEARKSDIVHKHACIAVCGKKIASPPFHNYMRVRIYNYKCGSAHAEMATINYLLGELWCEKWRKKQRCIL